MKKFLKFLSIILLIGFSGCISYQNTNTTEISNEDSMIIEFYSDNCPACQDLKPYLDEMESEGYNIVRINIYEDATLANDYGIRYVPTVIFIKDGKEVDRVVGSNPSEIRSKAETYLN